MMHQAQEIPTTQEQTDVTRPRTPYTPPTIVRELTLETRAGSPLGLPDPLDPLGTDPTE